jgi:hypothetical protein
MHMSRSDILKSKFKPTVNLSSVDPDHHDRIRDLLGGSWNDLETWFECLVWIGNSDALPFVFDNVVALVHLGFYEQLFIDAYTSPRTNLSWWPLRRLKWMLDIGDRKKFQQIGPLPLGDSFTLYRGVSGPKGKRRPTGISWTGTLQTAERFANRWTHLENPAVYMTICRRSDVYFYCNDREEDEYVLYTNRIRLLKQSELQRAA